MSKTGKPEDALTEAFAAARRTAPEPDADFLARVLADAEDVQDGFARADRTEPFAEDRERLALRGGWRGVFHALGGWPAVSGLSAAAVAGLWIGVAPPERLDATAQQVWGEDITLALQPDIGTDLFPEEEG
ncbi:hypothetical protein XM53_09525 [Roseovarius atlanticus]|uniref:Dihydroorotate dehydrogenase n=1 Tax=Roseovarius atlanticus TaxID=1641875 RepID=A0A0T5NV79_9RHOB|nr:hypothetical protein [Roseovarius atlanticus]KRS12804.1 hypothetical protein XM53_09525 [Roseovarius atlanticus]